MRRWGCEMSDLRTAAQQALEACEQRLPLNGQAAIIDELNNLRAALEQQAEPNAEYERGFIDGMQKQAQSSVDRAVNRMAEPERHFCERCGKRLSQDGVHTCTPLQQIEQAMLGVWQDVPGAVNFGITDPAAPRCLYPDCVGGKQGTICHDSCPGGNPSFG